MIKAIQVKLVIGTDTKPAHMIASCIGERSIERSLTALPLKHAACALAKLMCHHNRWPMDLVYGLLPNGDEVFCHRHSGREVTRH